MSETSRSCNRRGVMASLRMGPLVTEASHPRSTKPSQIARQDAAAGLAVLFYVPRNVEAQGPGSR